MTVTLAHTVEIGGVASPTDFTSRVLGFSVSQTARPQRISGNTAVITLDNNDGALTPNAGGTYAGVDWFGQGVFISTTVNGGSSQGVFYGLVDDFQLADNGTESTVTITALDWLAVLGRLSPRDFSGVANNDGPGEAISLIIGYKLTGPDDMAKVGATGALQSLGKYANDNGDVRITITSTATQFITDTLQNEVMSPDLCAVYAGQMTHYAPTDLVLYQPVIIGNTLTRSVTPDHSDSFNAFTFTGGTPASGELPLADVLTGYNTEELINTVYSTRDGGTTQTVQDSTSADAYGARTMAIANHAATADSDSLNGATDMVNRLSTSRFTAQKLYFDSGQLANTPAGSATQLETLLDIRYGLWQPATVSYTPAGAASQITETVLIYGRQVRAVPGRTSFVLDVLPAADYQSFKLDSSVIGVLDQNRLG